MRKLIERGLRPVMLDSRADESLIGADCKRAITLVEGSPTDAWMRRLKLSRFNA